MKKKASLAALIMVLSMLLCLPISAQDEMSFVLDKAGLLSAEDLSDLERNAGNIAATYDFGVYILTVDDFHNYTAAYDREGAAEEIYLNNDLGVGPDRDGMILMLSMEERDWAMFAFGYGNTAFTDYGKQYLADAFLDDFADNNWYDGFNDYLIRFNQMMEQSVNGTPVDVNTMPVPKISIFIGIVACIALGILIASGITGILAGQMKSVYAGDEAFEFIDKEGLRLSHKSDQYLHTTRTRVYDPPQQSSGGTSVGSSGGSSAGGKF